MKLILTIVALGIFCTAAAAAAAQTAEVPGIYGTVLDVDRAVITGVKITVAAGNGKIFSGVSGYCGEYDFNVPPGIYTLTFEQDGFKKTIYQNVGVRENKTKHLEVQMEQGSCNDCEWDTLHNPPSEKAFYVKGRVTDQNGAAIPQVEIVLEDERATKFRAVSDDKGRYKVTVSGGRYTMRAAARGFTVLTTIGIIIEKNGKDDSRQRDFYSMLRSLRCDHCENTVASPEGEAGKQPLIDVSGMIFDPHGALINAIRIVFRDSDGKEYKIYSDDDGKYTLRLREGIYSVKVAERGFKKLEGKVDLKNAQKFNFHLDMILVGNTSMTVY